MYNTILRPQAQCLPSQKAVLQEGLKQRPCEKEIVHLPRPAFQSSDSETDQTKLADCLATGERAYRFLGHREIGSTHLLKRRTLKSTPALTQMTPGKPEMVTRTSLSAHTADAMWRVSVESSHLNGRLRSFAERTGRVRVKALSACSACRRAERVQLIDSPDWGGPTLNAARLRPLISPMFTP